MPNSKSPIRFIVDEISSTTRSPRPLRAGYASVYMGYAAMNDGGLLDVTLGADAVVLTNPRFVTTVAVTSIVPTGTISIYGKARGPPCPHQSRRTELSERSDNQQRVNRMSVVKCIYGTSTENPCPRPGTVEQLDRFGAGVKVCEVHAALQPLGDEAWDLALALEKLDELEEYATEWNNQSLLGLVERTRVEFTERMKFLEKHIEQISLAGR